ncbi:hypothetical protein LTR91_016142 [Friedmanniomyces endolithicus]|uniref:Myb-like domain-containing protein n=1 Tax=Friedmanniomyces endolithicus TaxID=329885 RepID=A0AAN6QKZ6_9PEZI|nr:hypothetical protein LTR75_014666 [Friedmanniomyces endolithicus]KAK0785547.1 hypothetical protein LTR59_010985 [Friedmanniomyces endolithicus]KAK0803088.1 hypothetical protein LTR38_006274 [Friedmanniomyces endolithicus]KAK0852616.1 hypothetical protein LTR03_003329 [Friedmanniomyces endolithicus]KAK0858996.1 hypothetical protein LTS02_009531 [Friedmanniomyces endolithicus]
MADLRPWSNDEKNFLLAEILKQHSPPSNIFWNFVASLNPQPRWDDLPLPAGRSVNACRYAYDELPRSHPPSYITGPYGPQTPLSAPPPGIKRPFQLEPAFPGRVIAPRPSNLAPSGAGQPPASEPAPKRRRGRPPKAETQAREAAAAASRSEPGPAPPLAPHPQIPSRAVSTPVSAAPAPAEEPQPAQLSSTRMPISAVLTPVAPHTASSSSSSSGKRRRGRSMRIDPEGPPGGSAGASGQIYESPYGRAMGPLLEDTPARAAVMRHREEQQVTPQQLGPQPGSSAARPGAESGAGPSGS